MATWKGCSTRITWDTLSVLVRPSAAFGICVIHVAHAIDLHESAYTDRTQPLKAGMVITIEPGIFFDIFVNKADSIG